MTTAAPTTPDFSDAPNRFALLPLPNGDFQIVFREMFSGQDKWFVYYVRAAVELPAERTGELIHLAPIRTDVPDDLIQQFRSDLGLTDDE